MRNWSENLRRTWWFWLCLALLGTYWLLPISGQVIIIPGNAKALLGPQLHLAPASPYPGQKVRVWISDTEPWTYVLLTVNGRPAQQGQCPAGPEDPLVWEWTFMMPDEENCTLVFYHDCDDGCVERGRFTIGASQSPTKPYAHPTKLGVVFANPARDWHGRSGWDVELTYAQQADELYWGIDDLAARVHQVTSLGLRVLVRVDYAKGQSLPPANDYLALTQYLRYLRRLARDERLQDVYGYFIGSGYNAQGITAEWYARVFNGYGEETTHTDNVIQVMREGNPKVRVLVGPVQPWCSGQDGARHYAIDVPWLNYMNTLVAELDEAAQAKAKAGIPMAAPDGFAFQTPGRPDAAELVGRESMEPQIDLQPTSWHGAQAGFRVYKDWLNIINNYSTTRGLPVYITSINTFAPDEKIPPAQNYPQGWLTSALEVVNGEPQVQALCWFLDYFPHSPQWEWFSLTRHPGRMLDAAEEFDALLQDQP